MYFTPVNSGLMKHISSSNQTDNPHMCNVTCTQHEKNTEISYEKMVAYQKAAKRSCYSLDDYEKFMSQDEPYIPTQYDEYDAHIKEKNEKEMLQKQQDYIFDVEFYTAYQKYLDEHKYFSKFNDLSIEKEESYAVVEEPDEDDETNPTEYDTPQP